MQARPDEEVGEVRGCDEENGESKEREYGSHDVASAIPRSKRPLWGESERALASERKFNPREVLVELLGLSMM